MIAERLPEVPIFGTALTIIPDGKEESIRLFLFRLVLEVEVRLVRHQMLDVPVIFGAGEGRIEEWETLPS